MNNRYTEVGNFLSRNSSCIEQSSPLDDGRKFSGTKSISSIQDIDEELAINGYNLLDEAPLPIITPKKRKRRSTRELDAENLAQNLANQMRQATEKITFEKSRQSNEDIMMIVKALSAHPIFFFSKRHNCRLR